MDQRRPVDEQWIRYVGSIEDEDEHMLIICCTHAQAKAFQDAQCIQMDLSFKMIQGKVNLFSITGWNEEARRMYLILTLFTLLISD